MNWFALGAARAHDPMARLPFMVDGATVGSVARKDLAALGAWPRVLSVAPDVVVLHSAPERRDGVLADINRVLHVQGLIRGWRDEVYAIVDLASGRRVANTERAAARFWGTLTLGAHANGYVADAQGRPTHLWIARRSDTKATDPGLFDNLIGGGVPSHQDPRETLIREGFEEAGIGAAQMALAQTGRTLRVLRDLPEGLQREDLYIFDLDLPAGQVPQNQDGEVQRFDCLPVAGALALAASDAMTVDAALATLDFALRHDLLPLAEARTLTRSLEELLSPPHLGHQKP